MTAPLSGTFPLKGRGVRGNSGIAELHLVR
ncbi:hypothetical protein ACVMIH_005218 [Bradyrhizobium sp. USDA 4503]